MEMLRVEANTVSFNAALSACEAGASGWELPGFSWGLRGSGFRA